MKKVLDKHRDGIIIKEVAGGKEFRGQPFYSKPSVIHFKVMKVMVECVLLVNGLLNYPLFMTFHLFGQ